MSLLNKLEQVPSNPLVTVALVGATVVLGALAVRHTIEIRDLQSLNDRQQEFNGKALDVIVAHGVAIRDLQIKDVV